MVRLGVGSSRVALALLLVVVAGSPGAKEAGAADWSDTFLGYRWGTQYREPAIPDDIMKNIFQFQHVSGYKYGTNFFNVDMLKSNDKDPAAGGAGSGGAQEVYVVYRHQLSLNKVFKKDIHFGPVKGMGFTAGADFNAKDDAFAARVFKMVFGPTFNMKVPNGFWDISVFFRTERNHNAFTGRKVSFKNMYGFSTAWNIPFKGTPLKFVGFGDYVSGKGQDGFDTETKPETLIEGALFVDVGSLVSKSKGKFFLGVGYQFWNNKFGVDPATAGRCQCGARATVPQLELEIHF
jgi:nucleoside-specific outer membrane channel protein Tsx